MNEMMVLDSLCGPLCLGGVSLKHFFLTRQKMAGITNSRKNPEIALDAMMGTRDAGRRTVQNNQEQKQANKQTDKQTKQTNAYVSLQYTSDDDC